VVTVGSRVRVAASACLVASGLLIAGLGSALALADPENGGEQSDDGRFQESTGGDSQDGGGVGKGSDDGIRDPNGGKDPDPDDGKDPGSEPPKEEPPNTNTKTDAPTNTGPETETEMESETVVTSYPPTTLRTPTTTSRTPTTTARTTTTTKTTTTSDKPTTTSETPTTPTTATLPGEPPGGGGGGGLGEVIELPSGRPEPPEMRLSPQETVEGALDEAPGLAAAAGAAPLPLIGLPAVVVPPVVVPAPAGPRGLELPVGPKSIVSEPRAGRPSEPRGLGNNAAAAPLYYRLGYVEYLRSAGMAQVAAVALPGTAGLMAITSLGGLVGYRQAEAGNAIRTGAVRFLP
jgi:hypothetical protein